ncbi:MAG: 3-hydroxyacyl-CoA dehydrogenase family protein [Deltaproteobacteria bacterium]|nr:MAG: 3-hydroxyacyl-CoA dehydrogenase family protein [Deltaproteobacteria bacterium]
MAIEIQGPVTVLGAGTMGRGIAHVSALAGYPTRLFDVSHEQLEAARATIERNLGKGVDRGKIAPADRDRALENLEVVDDFGAAVDGADLVVEAVPERLDAKHDVLGRAAKLRGAQAIYATNTSSLSIDDIAAPLPQPERVIGMHFFNPVHIMKLLEIVVGAATHPEVVEAARRFGERIGKECIVVKNSPGFATSRLGLVIGLEAIRMVEEGVASPEDIDKAMVLGYGFPMGPLRLTDLVGLDVRLSIAEYLSEHLPEGAHFRPPALLRRMVEEGKLGKKSGEGFYRWDET